MHHCVCVHAADTPTARILLLACAATHARTRQMRRLRSLTQAAPATHGHTSAYATSQLCQCSSGLNSVVMSTAHSERRTVLMSATRSESRYIITPVRRTMTAVCAYSAPSGACSETVHAPRLSAARPHEGRCSGHPNSPRPSRAAVLRRRRAPHTPVLTPSAHVHRIHVDARSWSGPLRSSGCGRWGGRVHARTAADRAVV